MNGPRLFDLGAPHDNSGWLFDPSAQTGACRGLMQQCIRGLFS